MDSTAPTPNVHGRESNQISEATAAGAASSTSTPVPSNPSDSSRFKPSPALFHANIEASSKKEKGGSGDRALRKMGMTGEARMERRKKGGYKSQPSRKNKVLPSTGKRNLAVSPDACQHRPMHPQLESKKFLPLLSNLQELFSLLPVVQTLPPAPLLRIHWAGLKVRERHHTAQHTSVISHVGRGSLKNDVSQQGSGCRVYST